MNDLALAQDVVAPVAAPARSPDPPRWWQEWISQVLAATPPRPAAASPAAGRAAPDPSQPAPPDAMLAAARALREARRVLRELEAGADAEPLALAVARQQLHLARRAWQERVEQVGGPGAHWCLCALEGAASH
jgi:type VI protein secretion system component VasF